MVNNQFKDTRKRMKSRKFQKNSNKNLMENAMVTTTLAWQVEYAHHHKDNLLSVNKSTLTSLLKTCTSN